MKSKCLIAGVAFAGFSFVTLAAVSADPSPQSIPHGQHDVKLATAGTYTLDPNHVALLARVSHLGFSISVFRFGKVAATLKWDPAHIDKSTLTASVQTASIESNVHGFAKILEGDEYLKSAKFPTATYTSTAFRQTDAEHGKVDGRFTLFGKTVPLTFDVALVGAGPGFAGSPVIGHVIGIHAETAIDPQTFGMSPFFTVPIQLIIDTEFDKPGK